MVTQHADVRIPVSMEAIVDICRRYEVKELAFFGSVLRDDFTDQSDVDVVVEFLPDTTPSLLDLAGLHCDLEDLLERKVDVTDKRGIRPFLVEEILSTRRIVYVAA